MWWKGYGVLGSGLVDVDDVDNVVNGHEEEDEGDEEVKEADGSKDGRRREGGGEQGRPFARRRGDERWRFCGRKFFFCGGPIFAATPNSTASSTCQTSTATTVAPACRTLSLHELFDRLLGLGALVVSIVAFTNLNASQGRTGCDGKFRDDQSMLTDQQRELSCGQRSPSRKCEREGKSGREEKERESVCVYVYMCVYYWTSVVSAVTAMPPFHFRGTCSPQLYWYHS